MILERTRVLLVSKCLLLGVSFTTLYEFVTVKDLTEKKFNYNFIPLRYCLLGLFFFYTLIFFFFLETRVLLCSPVLELII